MQAAQQTTQQNGLTSADFPEGQMQVITKKLVNGQAHIRKHVFNDCEFGIGDEKELEAHATETLDPDTFDNLLAAKAFEFCLNAEPQEGKVYVVQSPNVPKAPLRFAQFIGKRIRMNVEYLGWGSMKSLDDDWMHIGETVYGPKGVALVEYPAGSDRCPTVIAEVIRI